MTRIRAENDIIVPKPGQPGAGTLLYKAGEMIREEDLEALGLAQAKPAAAPQDKAKRGPRDAPKRTRASRDKALADPNESKED